MKLNDRSPMPFGKHHGEPMEEVPVNYLHWLWNDRLHKFPRHPVHQYIADSMGALEIENPDLIWKQAEEAS